MHLPHLFPSPSVLVCTTCASDSVNFDTKIHKLLKRQIPQIMHIIFKRHHNINNKNTDCNVVKSEAQNSSCILAKMQRLIVINVPGRQQFRSLFLTFQLLHHVAFTDAYIRHETSLSLFSFKSANVACTCMCWCIFMCMCWCIYIYIYIHMCMY